MQWRKAGRQRLIAGRLAIPSDIRRRHADQIAAPNMVIAPVVGFDRGCYRLGYGGGFFDLTLARMKNSPLKLGVGYQQQGLLTIHPQPNDIPMDMVITEGSVVPAVS